VKFLVSESQARGILPDRNSEKLVEELIPYVLSDLFVEEVMNLEYKQAGNDTQVKGISKSIPKDKFSAIEYGLWYIHLEEKKNQRRKKEVYDPSSLFMFKKPSPY
jgi:hypothetical protein